MDIAIAFDNTAMTFGLAHAGADLASESGLRTAVLISLFTDRRARTDDVIPDGTADRRGAWSDHYLEHPNDSEGSRLWLLAREKELPHVLSRAREYALEALQWLIDDGVARAVSAQAEWVRRSVLGIRVTITRADGTLYQDVFSYGLEAH